MCWVRVSDGFPHACGLCVCGGAVYDVVMTEVFLRTTANKAGYVTVRVQNATGEVVLNGALSLLDRRVEMVPHADGVLGFEPLSNGTWLMEVRANGATVVYGKVLVLPSPIDAPPGNDSWEFVLDAAEGMALVDVVLNQGPRGYSAYDVAVMEGFVGTKAEWLEHMRQQTATLAVERVTPLMERAEAAAGDAERESAAAKTAQEAATAQAAAARESKLAAAAHKAAAADEVTKARRERETAAGHAAAAAKSALDALDNQQGAEQAAQEAAQAQVAATAAKNDADAAKLDAQTSEQNAKASADAAAADKTAAEKAKNDALAAQGKAEEEAVKAANNAALLGDAALKSGDNVFSGSNVFNGALSGSGTLCGLPFGSAFGLANALQGVSLSPEEFFMLFPDHKDMEVWPGLDNPTAVIKEADMPKLKHVFMFLQRSWYVYVPDVPINEAGELFVCQVAKGTIQAGVRPRCGRTVVIFPEYLNNLNFKISGHNYMFNVYIFAPQTPSFSFGWEWDGGVGAKIIFLGSQVYKRLVGFKDQKFCDLPVSFKGFNSPECVSVDMSWAGLDKESILELVGSLPTYDAETMTEVPSCTLYVRPEYEGDEEITAALLNLQTAVEDGGKGWTLAVNGATLTPAATFGLRRFMYLLRSRCDSGDYVDAEGFRWDVRGGQTVLRNYVANEQLGYEAFATLEDALGQWGLTEYQPEESKAD